MKIRNTNLNQYAQATAQKYIQKNLPVYSLSSEIETMYQYEDKKKTDKIDGYRLWFVQEGLTPFLIKFKQKPTLPNFLEIVEFENLEAIEIRPNVYFRADGLKVVK